MLDDARREQNNVQLPINNWLTNNFTLELIRAKVAVNKANGAESRSPSAALSQRACGSTVGDAASHRSISAEALAAIEATLPEGREADRRPDGKGGYIITLSHGVVDRLNYLRRNGLELQRRPPGAGGGVRGRTLRDAR
jgi:hypothetical protein